MCYKLFIHHHCYTYHDAYYQYPTSDWNPAMDAQAQDRAHRIGQTREVHIYRLVCASTIEENILTKAMQKKHLDFLVMTEGNFNEDSLFSSKGLKDVLKLPNNEEDITTNNNDDMSIASATSSKSSHQKRSQQQAQSNAKQRLEMEAAMSAVEDEDDVQAMRGVVSEIAQEGDEFNDNKGAVLAAKFEALSADHLLQTSEDGILALANSKTVATLLPGTGLFLGKKQANARAFLDAGVKVSIASDYNPGSCHCDNLILIASLAAPLYGLNQAELWSAITLNAAHAVGLTKQGAIVEGLRPRFSIFHTDSIDKITYSWGKNLAN